MVRGKSDGASVAVDVACSANQMVCDCDTRQSLLFSQLKNWRNAFILLQLSEAFGRPVYGLGKNRRAKSTASGATSVVKSVFHYTP